MLIPLPGGISAVAHGLMALDDPDRTLLHAGIAFTVLYIRMWHPGREDVAHLVEQSRKWVHTSALTQRFTSTYAMHVPFGRSIAVHAAWRY